MDADWAGDPEDRKSTTEAIVFYHGNPVSWISQKQKTVSTSTSEAEYKTMTYAFKEGLYSIKSHRKSWSKSSLQ